MSRHKREGQGGDPDPLNTEAASNASSALDTTKGSAARQGDEIAIAAYDPFSDDDGAQIIDMPTVPKEIDWALGQGYALVPVRIEGGKKVPKRRQWNTKRVDPADIRRIARRRNPADLFAVVTGRLSNLISLDADGEVGMATMRKFGIPPTLTTPGAGGHWWISAPGVRARSQGYSAALPMVEVKADNGKATFFGVNPEKGGKAYEFTQWPPLITNYADLPLALRNHIESKPSNVEGGVPEWWLTKRLHDALQKIADGEGRNDVGTWFIERLWHQLCSAEVMEQWGQRYQEAVTGLRDEPYALDEINDTIRSLLARDPARRDPEAIMNPPLELDTSNTWRPIDLGAVMRDDTSVERPTLMRRSDGACFMYAGRIHSINSEPEAGKTWVALFLCVEVMHAGGCVVYIDFEDGAPGIVGRLLAFGIPQEQIEALFVYVRPDEPFGAAAETLILSVLEERKPHLVVLDGITEAMSLHGLSIKDNDDSAKFMKMLPRLIARTGAAVLQLDHVTKNKEGRDRWAIGAQHKLAGIDGASYGLESLQPFGRGLTGSSKLTVFKDRPGFVRPQASSGKVAGVFTLASTADGSVTASFTPPGTVEPGSAGDIDDDVLQKVSDFLAGCSGPPSQIQVKKAVNRNNVTVDLALKLLESQGYATYEMGPRKAKLWRLLRPWTPEDEQ